MKTAEARQIPPEVRGNMRADLTEAVVELGEATIKLEDVLDRARPSEGAIAFHTATIDGKIGNLRRQLVLLEKISYGALLDVWLKLMSEDTEANLEVVIAVIDFARDAKPRTLAREYPALRERANWALENLYRLWGIPLPDEEETRMLESGNG